MKKTALITGTSSGIGKATVRYFAEQGWNVAATMRTPQKETELAQLPNVRLYALDVTDPQSIQQAISSALTDFGGIDVIVNNAGYGAVGIFEKATPEQIRKQFDTNVFGVMNVVREILPYFRKNRAGTIINVTSMGGRITFPIYSVYHGTKWAVEGWAEALQFELRPLNIRVKNVEPGAIKTDFYERSMDLFQKEGLTDYDRYEQITYNNSQKAGEDAPGPEVVAKTIYRAATDGSSKLRYPASTQSSMLLFMRWVLPLNGFMGIVRMAVEKGFKS
ncbi:SDR family oxidoreductase [Runella slithyformis]|uniref:Short-chain dehydrogenase/reductase SDR n=1 Tax=Runella slithyformis (strain ATCC 29530 / DSM 19594 / LMG 11500 / NCIMB 11436 / LSU 4) TaxID=761193 RepID=A0A7U3ZMX5_RUNSL|nr:SDR family oxidoreductase [Runella slithyformis]AEI50048.1 short-chain dehydrogenase/reductase SDR [Runella slithyformis DSM 19594]